ncbi:MAG: class I SAM-dependent methyltransferase [Algicola sp.]|nr:class I SAM-dependent methyltransferase [Algicola sp.]
MNTDKLPFIIRKLLNFRRKGRVNFMLSKIITKDKMNIIDIGCGIDGRSFDAHVPADWKITGVDILPVERVQHQHPNFTYLKQDAQDLSRFNNNEFDLAVSIGMLEHITEENAFKSVVSEIRRVSKQYIVVVPYKYCWIEPHYGIPFFPLLPYSVKLALIKAFNLSDHRKAVSLDPDYINKHFRWLSNAQYREEFPDSTIYLLPTLETIAITRTCQL